MAYLLDTNVAVRAVVEAEELHGLCLDAIAKLSILGERPVVGAQVLAEAWSLLTRPSSNRGGFGFSPDQADARIDIILSIGLLLPEPPDIWAGHRRLLVTHQVSGVQTHDCRLAAWCLLHGIDFILTLNGGDFARFGVPTVHPESV